MAPGQFVFRPGDIILGLDPGVESLGWGAVQVASPSQVEWLGHGCSTTLARQTMPDRIDAQARAVLGLVERYHPAAIAVEAWVPYHGKHGAGDNTMRVCGVVRALGVAFHIPVVEYTAQAVKGIVLENRNAEKVEVQEAVQAFLSLGKLPRPNHAADGLAAAIAHWRARAVPGDVVSKSVGLRKV